GRGQRAARCRAARLPRCGRGDSAPLAAVQPALLREPPRARVAQLLDRALPGEPGAARRAPAGAAPPRDAAARLPGVAPHPLPRLPRLLRQSDRLPPATAAAAAAGGGGGAGREPRAVRVGLPRRLPAAERTARPARRRARPARGPAAGARPRA